MQVVCAFYNDTLDSIITAAGNSVRVWDSSSGSALRTFEVWPKPSYFLTLTDHDTKLQTPNCKLQTPIPKPYTPNPESQASIPQIPNPKLHDLKPEI